MNIFIARAGEILGEYPQEYLAKWARAGNLDPGDHYWHDGMEDWLPLPDLLGLAAWEPAPPPVAPPPPASPLDRRILLGALAAAVMVCALIGFLIIKPNRSDQRIAAISANTPPPLDAAAELALRDKAAADLRQRIERLPATAKPPLNTFYYDVQVHMRKTFDRQAPWSAVIHGWQNLIDPETDKTLSRTDFVLTTDYQGSKWVYKNYRAIETEMATQTSRQVEDNNGSTPPGIMEMLRLTRRETPNRPQPTASNVPGFQ